MLSRSLFALRDVSVTLGLAALLLFPLPSALWGMAGALWPSLPGDFPLLAVLFEGWDSGGQQPLGRALLRLVVLALVLASLALPGRSEWRRPPWWLAGEAFLLLGLASALLSPHLFEALREWETWLLAGLLVYSVATRWQPRWQTGLVVATYGLTVLALLHSLMVGLAGPSARVGGPFHHPNAFSTFALMLLPSAVSRAGSGSSDAPLGQACCGVLVGLTLISGSLTGLALLTGLFWFAVLQSKPTGRRVAAALVVAGVTVLANLFGGGAALLTGPALLLSGWLWPLASPRRSRWLATTGGAALLVGMMLLAQSALAPGESAGAGQTSRAASGSGRLQFYQVAAFLALEHPLLGVGPGGFSRHYPAHQGSVEYFSRFPHGWPIEVASEWGIPALLALLLMLVQLFRTPPASEGGRCAVAMLWIFALHACTDTQTQFPYLMLLAAVALGVLASSSDSAPLGETGLTRWTRTLLALACLGLVAVSIAQLAAAGDRALAMAIARRVSGENGKVAVERLLQASYQSDPLDSEAARLWGLALLSGGRPDLAAEVGRQALRLDPRRAACLYLLLSAEPPSPARAEAAYRGAIALDRVNYPVFYRWLAEALAAEGRTDEALRLLREQAALYSADKLAALFSFRADDLSDQLVEYHGFLALLEEAERKGAGEPELRLALQRCGSHPERARRLRSYLSRFLTGAFSAEARGLLHQIPAQDAPPAVKAPLDDPRQLELSQPRG